ncbi:hypothetical protein L083_1996 [Actinoplanes sp. N902-109]|nr:hypothetical protein L083_1996 [Actinoplanes sp. N902-109]
MGCAGAVAARAAGSGPDAGGDRRQMINAICWVERTGSPWRDLLEALSPMAG